MTMTDIKLPEAFTTYIEQTYYGQVTEQSKLEAVVRDPAFLKNPLKHVALFSDHGILHGRDIASKITRVIQQIQGLLIPSRTSNRLEFMLGYGALLAYLHDIGMKNFSAFGRAMHPEFAAQLMFTTEFDPWIDLLWQNNAGNVAWRLLNLAAQGAIQEPQRVLREMLALSMAHSKTKVPIACLNNLPLLQQTMQTCVGTELHYLYQQQQVAIAEKKLAQQQAQRQSAAEGDRGSEKLEQAKAALAEFVAASSGDPDAADRWRNPDLLRYYDRYEQTAFSWLTAADPAVQLLTLDVIDTVRALRCADALRQRGTSFTTSAGYEVFVCQETANAIYALRSRDRDRLFLLEGKDPISAGEANMANSNLDQEGNLRLAFTRGTFSTPEATRWAAFSAAVVIQDIQADVIVSFRRPEPAQALDPGETYTKREQDMQILVEGVDDNPAFADLICQELSQLNPELTPRIKAVTSLQNVDLKQVERYLGGTQPPWGITEKLHLLDHVVKTGQKVDPIDLEVAFAETRLITVKAGEVLIERGVLSGFVYIPLQAGLMNVTERQAALPWVQIGDVEVIRGAIASVQVVAEQTVELLMIPKQIYMRHWYVSYDTDEFTQMFAQGDFQPRLPSKRTTSLEMDLQRLTRRSRALPLAVHLMQIFPQSDPLECFMGYLEEMQLLPGEPLFCQGDRPEALYFLEVGQVELAAIAPDQPEQRQPPQIFDAGDWIGGWEFYSRANYLQTALAQRSSTLHRLSIEAMQQMQADSPQVAQRFAEYLLSSLATQLLQARQEITTLLQERTEIIERLTTLQRP
ncbi:MAG: cyclic nucleotide-binding domain-containing protein [Oscillatoriophycideae cyanobacterium NC_groundwater_1537_Pr4_S-0.65um_50_18]|nr:cyclic nucleotide-binding domain-containing protein [Oscillatoriophycideae cyanobacterium NC_groundwater_1537_Pr4_S-0.65um_50_18]